jgi:hypothetical protein
MIIGNCPFFTLEAASPSLVVERRGRYDGQYKSVFLNFAKSQCACFAMRIETATPDDGWLQYHLGPA